MTAACQGSTFPVSPVEFLLTDQVGTLRAVADTSGNIVKRIDYDSFGNIISDSNPAFSVPFGFAGGLHDHDTGLVRFGYRDYSPELGRFVAKDPIDFAGGDTNLYAYTMSDPINRIDVLGLDYLDLNVSMGWFGIGVTGGIQFDDKGGVYPYVGGGAMTPGFGVALTKSPSDPSTGWIVAGQLQYAGAAQGGYSFRDKTWFYEYGIGSPGASLTGYYVWGPFLKPPGPIQPKPILEPVKCH